VISAKNANGQYYAGATALRGQSPWMPRGAFNYSPNPGENGMANTAIFARGDVNPTSRAVTTMRLPPPTGAPRDTRPLLSGQTIREGGPGPAPAATAPSAPTADWVTSPGARKLPEPYRPMVAKAGSDEGVDPDWITAIMMQESGGVPTAQSGAGASGLMQLIPPTARAMGVTDIFDPAQNIRGGARYFKQMLDQFKDPKLALAAYNAGPGAVTRYNGVPPYSETQHYVTRVSQNYANIKAERGDQQRGLAPGTEAESDYAEAPAPEVPAPEEAASPRERLGARLLSDMRRPPEEGTYGGPRELARVAEAAQRENPWNTDPNAQPARHAGMRAFFEMPEPERDQIYTQSLEQALTDEGITDPAERQRWAQNMRLVAKGDARVPGENPSLNPFMMAGEGRGTPLYANSAADKGPHSNELNSSAMGYYQFIIHDPRDPNKDPYGHRAYIPPGGNFFDPVTQQRMFIRAIRGSAKHHGDPASVVREKWSKSDHTWGP
jgi:soluble lytic murein transglycosylase-like protein